MTDEPAPAPSPATAIVPVDDGPRALDAHGFDPNAYDWVPVLRKPRSDGWSPEKQRAFVAALADTGSVTQAARAVGMSAKSAYALRRAPEGAGFDRAWAAAVRQGMNRLVDVCLERAMEGTEEAILDKDGRVIGHRTRHHDRMAMFLLRAHMPELFRDAHRADRARGEAIPARPEPVAVAAGAIDPVVPADPAALMAPGDLAAALQVADLMDGQLPRWHRDPDLVGQERGAAASDARHAAAAARRTVRARSGGGQGRKLASTAHQATAATRPRLGVTFVTFGAPHPSAAFSSFASRSPARSTCNRAAGTQAAIVA